MCGLSHWNHRGRSTAYSLRQLESQIRWGTTTLLQIIELDSTRMQDFRSTTWGYTGHKKRLLRSFNFSEDHLDSLREEIERVQSKEWRAFDSAYELTQFLRGRLFLAVDSLLCREYKSEEDKLRAHSLIKVFLKFLVSWLKWMVSNPSSVRFVNFIRESKWWNTQNSSKWTGEQPMPLAGDNSSSHSNRFCVRMHELSHSLRMIAYPQSKW